MQRHETQHTASQEFSVLEQKATVNNNFRANKLTHSLTRTRTYVPKHAHLHTHIKWKRPRQNERKYENTFIKRTNTHTHTEQVEVCRPDCNIKQTNMKKTTSTTKTLSLSLSLSQRTQYFVISFLCRRRCCSAASSFSISFLWYCRYLFRLIIYCLWLWLSHSLIIYACVCMCLCKSFITPLSQFALFDAKTKQNKTQRNERERE